MLEFKITSSAGDWCRHQVEKCKQFFLSIGNFLISYNKAVASPQDCTCFTLYSLADLFKGTLWKAFSFMLQLMRKQYSGTTTCQLFLQLSEELVQGITQQENRNWVLLVESLIV